MSSVAKPVKMHAFMLHWSEGVVDAKNIQEVRTALEEHGMFVSSVTEANIGLHEGMAKDQQRRVVRQKLWQLLRESDPDEKDHLFIFCYIGHGTSRPQMDHDGDYTEWTFDHLFAHNESMSLEIDLTWIQTILRNTSDSDVLFIFEYCEGAHDGMDPLPSPGSSTWENYPEHKVWTISAGPGSIWITNDGRDFTRRLVANLRADRGPTTVLDRFQAMQKAVKFNMGADHHAPLDIKQQMPYGDIILQPQGETESVNGVETESSVE